MDPGIIQSLLALGYGENAEIPYEKLVIPERFQRLLKPRNWATFIPALFGRVLVAEVDGVLLLCDGFHRVEEGQVAGMWETQDVPSILFRGGTFEQAVALFEMPNDARVSLSAAIKFRAHCLMGDGEAMALDADLLDIDLDGWCNDRAEKNLGAIGTVVALAEKYGRAHAMYTLDIVREIWPWVDENGEKPDEEDTAYSQFTPNIRIVKGFGEYLRPEKRQGGRRRLRKWNQENGPLLTSYIAEKYSGANGHELFILRAQAKKVGGGGGASAVGMELLIHDCFLAARRQQREAA